MDLIDMEGGFFVYICSSAKISVESGREGYVDFTPTGALDAKFK